MKKTSTIILAIMLLAALVGAVILVNQNQEMRKGAAFDTSTLQVLPAEKITANLGDNFSAAVWYYTTANSKVDGVQTVVCYGAGVSLASIEVNTAAGFSSDSITMTKNNADGVCTTVVVTSMKDATGLATTGRAFTLHFKGIVVGTGTIGLSTSTSMMTGDNPASPTDKNITVTGVTGTTYEIVQGGAPTTVPPTGEPTVPPTGEPTVPPTGDSLLLKFRMSFLGINNGAKCARAEDMPLTVIVRASDGGSQEVTNNVIAIRETFTDANALATYSVKVPLTTFNSTGNFAVFVKGPKSLQVKYGVQDQSAYYNKAGGELSGLTKDDATTKVFDFTKYPLLAGDVVDGTGTVGVQDGVVNGLDFSYVKAQSIARTAVADGGFMLADLNGNCKMESQDLSILMLSLKEKQAQLY